MSDTINRSQTQVGVFQPGALNQTIQRNLRENSRVQLQSIFRISTGQRINTAADDPAGIGISEKMRAQIRGLDMASRNIQNASSMVQTAEGAMQAIVELLHNVRDLVLQAANDTLEAEQGIAQPVDRERIQVEINSMLDEIDRISSTAEFNRILLIDGTWARYRHETRWFPRPGHPGVPGFPGTPGHWNEGPAPTAGRIVGDYLFFLTPTLSPGNTVQEVHTALFNDMSSLGFDLDPSISSSDWSEIVRVAVDRAVINLIGYGGTAGHPGVNSTDPNNARNVSVRNWLQGGGGFGDLYAQGITSLSMLHNRWELLDSNPPSGITVTSEMLDAQQALFRAMRNADLGNYVNYNDRQWIPGQSPRPGAPPIQGGWVQETHRIYDPNRPLFFQVGANADQGTRLHIEELAVNVLGLEFLRNELLEEGRGVMRRSGAQFRHFGPAGTPFVEHVDQAISFVNHQRAQMGAMERRLQHSHNFAVESSRTHSIADSRIRDTDMASEVMRLARANVRQNVSTLFLAQANQRPNMVVSLLEGAGSVISQVASSRT